MLCLAEHYGEGPVLLRTIAEQEEVSLKYLEQLVIPLRAAGLIKSVRGAKGGYLLAREPVDIKLIDFLEPLEGGMTLVDCTDFPEICNRSEGCQARHLWCDLRDLIAEKLTATTLADLMARR